MNENKISWCLKQKRGIELIESKPHLSEAYMDEADDCIDNMLITKGKWQVIISYYACYNALYSLLMKVGIKSEIHDCTIELMKLFKFKDNNIEFIKDLKQDREKVQYYLKEIELKDTNKIKEFVMICKTLLEDLNSEKIEEIRNILK